MDNRGTLFGLPVFGAAVTLALAVYTMALLHIPLGSEESVAFGGVAAGLGFVIGLFMSVGLARRR